MTSMNDLDTTSDLEALAAEQEAADARATRLLIRIGIVSVIVLLVWIGVVVASFGH
jgi:hypothetical protein